MELSNKSSQKGNDIRSDVLIWSLNLLVTLAISNLKSPLLYSLLYICCNYLFSLNQLISKTAKLTFFQQIFSYLIGFFGGFKLHITIQITWPCNQSFIVLFTLYLLQLKLTSLKLDCFVS